MAVGRHRRHDARRLAAQQGGRPARLPAVRGRPRGVGAAGHGRRDRRARRRPDRPGALLPRGVAGRRRGLLLRPPAGSRAGAGGRGAVPPPGLAAPGGHRPGAGRHGLRRRPGHDQLLRRALLLGRPVALGLRVGRHGAAHRRLARRPGRDRTRAPRLRGGPDRRRRADLAVRQPGRPGLRLDRPRRPPRAARRRRPGPTRRTRTGSTCCPRTRRRCSRTSPSWTAPSSVRAASCWRPGPGTRSAR